MPRTISGSSRSRSPTSRTRPPPSRRCRPSSAAYRRTDGRCDPARQGAPADGVAGFWGVGRMIDWTDPAAGAWVHAERRSPNLADLGHHRALDRSRRARELRPRRLLRGGRDDRRRAQERARRRPQPLQPDVEQGDLGRLRRPRRPAEPPRAGEPAAVHPHPLGRRRHPALSARRCGRATSRATSSRSPPT